MTRSTHEGISRQEYDQLSEREKTLLTQQFASDIRKTVAWQVYSGSMVLSSAYSLYKKASISGVFLFVTTSTVKLLDYSGVDADPAKAGLGFLSMIAGVFNDPWALILNLAAGYATTQLSQMALFNDYLALSNDMRADPYCEKMNRLAAATITFEVVGGLAAKSVSDGLKKNKTGEQKPTREQQKPKVFIKDEQGRLHHAVGSASDTPTQVPEGCTLVTEAELNQVSIRNQQELFPQVEIDESQSSNPNTPTTESDPTPDLTEIDDRIASLEKDISTLQGDIIKAETDYDMKKNQKDAVIAGINNINRDAHKPKNAEDVYAWVTEGDNDVNFKPRGNTNGHSRTVRTGRPGTVVMGKRQGELDPYVAPTNQEIEASKDHWQDLLGREKTLKDELRSLSARAVDIEPTLPPPGGPTGNRPSNPLPVPDSNTGTVTEGQPSGSSAGNNNGKDGSLDRVAKFMTDIDKAKQIENARKGVDAKKNKAETKKKRPESYRTWYDSDQLLALLEARTQQNQYVQVHACVDGVTQRSADVDGDGHNVLRNSLMDVICNRRENNAQALEDQPNEWIVPINLGNDTSFNTRFENASPTERTGLQAGSHWVLLHIQFEKTSETAEAITYIDSRSEVIHPHVSQVLSALFPLTDVSNESHTQQQDNFSCGDWCCAAASYLVNGQTNPRDLSQDDVYTMRDAHLLILGQQGLRDRENNPPRSSEHDEQSSGELKARASAAEQKAEQLAAENDHLKQELATQRDRNAANDQQRIEDAVARAGARRRRRSPQKAAGTVAGAAAFFQRHGDAGNNELHDLNKKADNGDQKRFGGNP